MPLQLRAEHLLAAILSSTEDAVLSFALDGTMQTWSPGAQRLYGYAESEVIGQPLSRLLPDGDASAFEGILRAAISGNFPKEKFSPFHRANTPSPNSLKNASIPALYHALPSPTRVHVHSRPKADFDKQLSIVHYQLSIVNLLHCIYYPDKPLHHSCSYI